MRSDSRIIMTDIVAHILIMWAVGNEEVRTFSLSELTLLKSRTYSALNHHHAHTALFTIFSCLKVLSQDFKVFSKLIDVVS